MWCSHTVLLIGSVLVCNAVGTIIIAISYFFHADLIRGKASVQAETYARLQTVLNAIAQADCNSHCQSGGNGNGVVIGTAPFCGGDCSADCHSDHCMPWPDSCWTGNKICCCGKSCH